MTFWRNIASIAARRLDMAECPDCPAGLPGQDPAFSTAVTALGAKLAKADGSADGHEFAAFAEVFHPDPASEQNIHRLYDLARQTTHGFESYAKRLAKRYRTCPQLLEDVLDGLFHIAKADGAVTQDEMDYLERVSDLFGLSPLSFRRLTADLAERLEVIVRFLAVLELFKQGFVDLDQTERFGDIEIVWTPGAHHDVTVDQILVDAYEG